MTSVDSPTTSIPNEWTATGEGNVNYRSSELEQFDIAAVKEASAHTWSMADRLDPNTFQLLKDRIDEDQE